MKQNLKKKLRKALESYKIRKEASTTGTSPVATGGVQYGGDIGTTPFAFSKHGARPETIKQGGYTLANKVKKSKNYTLENQVYSEPAYSSPAQNIEPVDTYIDKNGLVQHNDPDIDPNLVGFKQGSLPVCEISYKNLYEGINGLRYEQQSQPVVQTPPLSTVPTAQPVTTSPTKPSVNLTSYDVQDDFSKFDKNLKNSTEQIKVNLQKNIQDKILGKKIVVRASKGYKQPESDYTINVTGVSIDYYYDRYVIVIIGREEQKQKLSKFFIKPGYKIKILGASDKLKPKDQYQLAKSKALVDPKQTSSLSNTVTSDDEPTPEQSSSQEKPQQTISNTPTK
jgi:hypothetical protein